MGNDVKIFGSFGVSLNILDTCAGFKYQKLHIQRSHVKALDQPTQRCEEKLTNLNTSACIAGFIEKKIGCNPNIEGSQYSKLFPCRTKSQLLQLQNISSILSGLNENEVFVMTGCLSSCEKDVFSINVDQMTCNTGSFDGYLLDLAINDRIYEEKKQYIIYDFDSFIADVGGYMGLLLGCSIWSLYKEVEVYLKKCITSILSRIQKSSDKL